MGRTARGEGSSGHALLLLRPEELGFLRYLKQAKVPLNEFEFSWSKIADIGLQLEQLMQRNYFLNQSGKEAFKSYVRAYDSHQLKTIFDISTLDLQTVAKSFGFSVPPVVDLSKWIRLIALVVTPDLKAAARLLIPESVCKSGGHHSLVCVWRTR